jgi:hypothetical protein
MPAAPNPVDKLEVASAIILSIAALAASGASYQAGLWDGEQAAHYSQAGALRVEASRAALEGDAQRAIEVQTFGAWLQAKSRGDDKLADFFQARFPADFRPAFNAWMADQPLRNPSAPPTPFATSAYRSPGRAEARALDAKADMTFEKGQYDNAVSDAFEQGATVLAIALFFAGIGQVFKGRGTRIALLTVAGLALVAGLLRLVSLPIQMIGLGPPGAG